MFVGCPDFFSELFLPPAQPGITSNVEIKIGDTNRFTENDINEAIECVIDYFPDFKDCELLTIEYDEKWSDDFSSQYDNANTIVLKSSYHVFESSRETSFNNDYTYTEWGWVVVRADTKSKWELKDWGY